MADLFDEFGIGGAQGGGSDLLDEFGIEQPKTDGAFKRGWNKATNAMAVSANMAIGDNQAAAERLKVASDYNAANPGSQESQELMQAWETGDGISGGFSEVGGEFAKDWREASGLGAKLKSAAKNVSAVGETLAEQTGNMVAPMVGMGAGHAAGRAVGTPIGAGIGAIAGAPAAGVGAAPGAVAGGAIGGTVGGIGGSILGGTIGNAAQETGYMALGDVQEAGIDPGDVAAVRAYLDEHSGRLLKQGATKGAIIATVDRLTMGIASKLLNGPLRDATHRALANMGVDAADKAAVKAATQSDAFAAHLAGDAAYQSSKQGAERIARNMAAFAVDPAGEFTGEFAGKGFATGEWDAKDATLEAVMGLGQSGVMYAGQKAYQAATGIGRGAEPMVQPQPTAENPAPAPVPAPDPAAGPISRTAAQLPGPSIAGLLPDPVQTLYGDAAGNPSPDGPSRNVDREYRPTSRERGPQTFGPGMDQSVPRGEQAPIEGQLIRGAGSNAGQQADTRQPQTYDNEQSLGLPAPSIGIPDLRPEAIIVDGLGQAAPGRAATLQPVTPEERADGMTAQAVPGQRPSYQQVLERARQGGVSPDAIVAELGATKAQAIRAVKAARAEEAVLGVTFSGMPGANKARKALPDPDAFEVVKVAKGEWRLQRKAGQPPVVQQTAIQQPVAQPPITQQSAAQGNAGKPNKAASGRKVNRDRDTLTQAVIRLGGIKTEWRQDTTGDTKGNKFVPGVGALWSDKTGTSIDDMASLLDQNGYVPAGEMDNLGGVPWLQAALRDELSGRKTHVAPGSKLEEAQAAKAEADYLEAQIAAAAESGDLDAELYAKIDMAWDMGDDAAEMERRRLAAEAFAAELDEIFGDTPNEQKPEPAIGSTDRAPQGADSPADGNSGSAGEGEPGAVRGADARAESESEVTPALELQSQTEEELAAADAANKARIKAEEKAQAEADEKRRKEEERAQIKAQSEAQADNFTLGVSGEDALSGQTGMFDSQPSLSELGSRPATTQAAAEEAPATAEPQGSERQPISFTTGQPTSDYLADGSIIEDGQGQQYRVHYQRNDLVVAHPIIDGKAQVNAESGVRFHVGRHESADGRRTDPIYLVQARSNSGSLAKGGSKKGTIIPESADEYAARLRSLADEFDGTYYGRSLSPVARAMADHAIENGRRMTDAELEGLARQHDVPLDVVRQLTGSIFTYDAVLGASQRGEAGATALLRRARENAIGSAQAVAPAVEPNGFIKAPDGSLDFGEITPEMAQAAGRQAGKIRLQQGNESWGLQHIELRHGAEIRDAGFADVPAFVADIAQHIDQVWKPAATRQLVALHKVGNNRMMFVELQPGKDEAGDFYTVNTAFTSRKAEKKGWKLLWEARAQASGESGNRPSFAVSPPVAGGEVTNPSSQSSETSIAPPDGGKPAADQAGDRPAESKIEDAGEKLGGARKDQLRSVRERLDDMDDEAIAGSSLSQIWPKGELDKITDPFEAALYHVVRGLIPAKPRVPYRVKAWVGKVKAGRDILTTFGRLGADATVERLRAENPAMNIVADQIEVLMAIDRKHWGRIDNIRRAHGRYNQGGEMVPGSWVSLNIDGRGVTFYGHETVASAIPAIKKRVEGKSAPEKRLKFSIYTDRQTSDVFVVKEGDAEMRRLKTFKTVKEARAFLNDEYEAAVALWDAVKNRDNVTKSDMRRATNDPRVGQDHRNGKDVTPEQFIEAFGFRGIEFGNWVKQGAGGRERQGMLNDAYDAFMDLAGILNIPPKALSLEGKLGIGFGSRGSGKASAHYEPDLVVINLTKTKGAGSLAHEWFHAIDNYFARRRAEQPGSGIAMTDRETTYITYRPERMWVNKKHPSMRMARSELSRYQANHPSAPLYQEGNWEPDPNHPKGVRPQVEKAFAEMVATLNASPMLQRAKVIDGKTSDGYWSRIIERGARSFETYVIARLADQGFRNDYLANVQTLEQFSRDPGRYPYLTPDEQGPVNDAFDKLFATLETKETDQGVALFSPRGSYNIGQADQQFVSEPTATESGYETDLFGNPIPAPRGRAKAARSAGAGVRGDVQPASTLSDTPTPAGRYHVKTIVGTEVSRRLGTDRVNSFADLAQATQYLYRSAVERFDGIVTDKDGKPLAVVGGFKGDIDSATIPLGPTVAEAVRVNGAANIWLSHNHPSGLSGLSDADQRLHKKFADVFEGSGIQVRGLIAVGRGEFSATDGSTGSIPAEGATVRVPVVEREQVGAPLAVTVESPAAARLVAAEYYSEAGRPGMILLDTKHRVVGWAPFNPSMTTGPLRNTGGLNALYRAVSEGNAAVAILAHGGELDTLLVGTHDSGMNIAAGLNKAGVRVLDVINAETRHSRAEKGETVVGSTLYRLNEGRAKGIPLFSARAIANRVMAATGLNATVVNTEADLPADLQAQIKRDKATGRVAGVYHNGTAYLVASNLRDAKHAVSVMLHEAVGHGGVKSVLGDRLGKVMAGIYRDMPVAMRKELERRYAKQIANLSEADANVLIAEEYVAHLAETDPQHSVINRLVARLRQFLRDTFGDSMNMKWTRNDLVLLLAEARTAARNGGRGPGGTARMRETAAADALAALPEVDAADESAFVASLKGDAATRSFANALYRARGTESPFFKAWFGKSRMVDKQGQPIAFVHRSYGERDTFTDADLGKNTGTPTAALGHFLARKDVGNVERYGPVVEQFYIRMEKPKVITQAQFEAMGDWSLTKVQAYRKTLMEQGHDGLYIQGLSWPVVFEGRNIKAKRNQGTFDATASTRYSLAQTATAAFKRWFGDSKVVDESGRPLFSRPDLVASRKAAIFEGGVDSGASDAKPIADLLVSKAFSLKGLGGLEIPAQRKVLHGVLALGDDLKILRSVVDLVPVDVMNILERKNLSPETLFRDEAVLKELLSADRDGSVTMAIDIADALVGAVARMAAEGPPVDAGMTTPSGKRNSASRAGVDDSFHDQIVGQIKATGNNGDFDPANPDIRYSLNDDAATAEALRGLGLGGRGVDSMIEQIRNMTLADLKAKLSEWATRSEEGLFDGLAGIKRAEEAVGVKDANQQGYVSARMATGIADVMHGVLHYAAPEWRDGVIAGKANTRGLLDILGDLGQDNLTPWLGWLGGKRAQMLKAQGRENNLTDANIAELLAMGKGKEALFEKVYRDYAKTNEAVLDLAEQAGLIDKDARAKWATEYYVPFYRQDEAEGIFTAPRTKRGLSHQTGAFKALKGGKLPTNDLLTNILTGWTTRIDAAMKNKALLEVVDNLKGSEFLSDESPRFQQVLISRSQIAQQIRKDRKALAMAADMLGLPEGSKFLKVANQLMKPENEGFEKLWTKVAPTDPDIIRVQRGGKNEYYRVNDESLLRGLKFMEGSVFNDPITRIGRTFKRLLTTGVTASPDFILRNFIRDAAHAWMINKDGFVLGKDSIKGMRDALREDQDYRDLMFAGGSFQGGYVHGTDPEASAQIIRRALEKKGFSKQQQDSYLGSLVNTPAKAAAMLGRGWQSYRTLGDKVENANRLSTYKAALAAGKSKRQAAFEAKDLMDYSLRGNFAAAQWFTDVVPFLNARLQGLYKLGRAMKDDKTVIAKEVALKGAYIALFSLLLAGLNDDDERYQKLMDWDKDMHWHIFLGDQHFRIPKPFELGLIFGTIPERLLHALTGTQDGGDLAKAVSNGVFQTLAFNPVPQFYQPIRELQANRNFFRDMPIEDMSDEGKLPEARFDERTSAAGKLLGQLTGPTLGISPKQLDHLVQGYTGTLGGYVLGMSNLVAGAFDDAARPSVRAGDLPVIKVLYQGDDVRSTKYQSQFYDMMREADQLHRTIKAYREEGRVDAAAQLLESSRDKLRHRAALGMARQQLGAVRKQMDAVYRDTSMSGEAKRAKLDQFQVRANQIAERIVSRAGGDF